MWVLTSLLLTLAPQDVVVAGQSGPLPQLDYGQQVTCLTLKPTAEVPSGHFRVQCDEATRRCLAAPDMVLEDGVEGPERLSRERFCGLAPLVHRAVAEGWPFSRARAEVQPGWYRDDRGRVMQMNFDLSRRVVFGGAWAPAFASSGQAWTTGRAEPSFGVDLSWTGESDTELHRVHLLEGRALLGDVTRLEATLVRYDSTRQRERPPVRLTTFFGTPRRLDLDLNLTWAGELLRLESVAGHTFLTPASADLVLDLWHASHLESYVRLRVGPALEMEFPSRSVFVRASGGAEAQFVLDPTGFHHLSGSFLAEQLYLAPTTDGRSATPARLRGRFGYEVIVLAINDYPVSLCLDGRATWRDDLWLDGQMLWRGWEFSALAGLKLSFWAPPRHAVEK